MAERAGLTDVGAAPRPQPLYKQVKQHLVRRVIAGDWRPGETLPSEMKLADEYRLSQGTVRKAIEEMAKEGLVSRQAGRGTFVTSHSGDYRPFRFHRLFTEAGEKVAGENVEFIRCRLGVADQRIAETLKIAAGDEGADTLRIRRLSGKPVLVERIFVAENLCPGIREMLESTQPASIYLLLEQSYNILITLVEEKVRARGASTEEAQLLELPPESPVLEVERVAYSLGGEPVEWRTMTCETSRIHYSTASG